MNHKFTVLPVPDKMNANRCIYSKLAIDSAIDRYIAEYIETGRSLVYNKLPAFGFINPPLDAAIGMVESIEYDVDKQAYVASMRFINTPSGINLSRLFDVNPKYVNSFSLATNKVGMLTRVGDPMDDSLDAPVSPTHICVDMNLIIGSMSFISTANDVIDGPILQIE